MSFKTLKLISLLLLAIVGILKPAAAEPNPSGLTGQYSCVINRQHAPFSTNLNGAGGVGVMITGFFDYTKNSGSMIITGVNNFGTKSVNSEQESVDFTFTETKHPTVANTFNLTVKLPGNEIANFIHMPVNGKNTLMVTSSDNKSSKAPWNGICQKI